MGFLDSITGDSVLSAAASWFGGEEQNRSAAARARDASVASSKEAQANRDWQERMSNTSYQRAVKDMEAAGLNPMLAFQQGGASTPSGAVGMAFQSQVPSNSMGSAVDAFQRSRSVSADVGLKKEQEGATSASASKTKQDEQTSKAVEQDALQGALLKKAQARAASAQEVYSLAQARKTDEEAKYIASQRAEVEAKSPMWNILHGVTKKVKDFTESSSAENVKRMRDNLDSLKFKGQKDAPRSITIYGYPK